MKVRRKVAVSEDKGYCLSVDPGINGTGIALWSSETWAQAVIPLKVANLYAPKATQGGWLGRAREVSRRLGEWLQEYKPVAVYIELPHYMESESGHAAMAGGGLIKLATFIGSVSQRAWDSGADVRLYPVREWKGEMPKTVVIERIKRLIPNVTVLNPVSHSYDAIGIGLYAKGVWHVPTRGVGGISREVERLRQVSSRLSGREARRR